MIKYPQFCDPKILYDINVTVVKLYEPGYSIKTILSEKPNIIISDWDANIFDSISNDHIKMIDINDEIIDFATTIGLRSYQIFFDINLVMVDFVSDSCNFISPQMLKLMFPKFETQEILKTCIFSKDIELTCNNCIIKKNYNNKLEPEYAKIL